MLRCLVLYCWSGRWLATLHTLLRNSNCSVLQRIDILDANIIEMSHVSVKNVILDIIPVLTFNFVTIIHTISVSIDR